MTEFAQDRRLTCNRIFRHLMFYGQQEFSGRLDVNAANGAGWSIYMNEGKIVWATGGLHPRRRWQRQLHRATGRSPSFFSYNNSNTKPFWDYLELQQLARHTLSLDRVGTIIQGTLTEVLFDIVQAFELPLAQVTTRHDRPILPLSKLVGVGDGMQVNPVGDTDLRRYYASPAWIPSAWLLQKETQAAWERWVSLGLMNASPDSAPVITDPEKLQSQVSNQAFQNLTGLLDGNRTFRDISLRSGDQFGAGNVLAPYIHKGLVGFHAVGDAIERKPSDEPIAETPIIVCFDADRQNHSLLGRLAAGAGCSYEAMVDDIEAIYALSRSDFPIPTLILVAERLTALSAGDACRILRRIDRLRSVPIVAYSEELRGPQQIQQVLSAGATEYLSGREFNPQGLLALFEQHASAHQARSNGRSPHRQLAVTFDAGGQGLAIMLAQQEQLTLEEFLQLPEIEAAGDRPDGETIRKARPQGKHSVLLRELIFFLTSALQPQKIAQAFPELSCSFGDRDIITNVAVFREERIPRDGNGDIADAFNSPPDWAIEILSPHQNQTKVMRDILHCLDNGTTMGWLIDPEEFCVFICRADKSVDILDRMEAELPIPELARGARLTLGELFGWLQR